MSNSNYHTLTELDYTQAEEVFVRLLQHDNLDKYIDDTPEFEKYFSHALDFAIATAYHDSPKSRNTHLFIQRVLYRINRLRLFWYDDLKNYSNENSSFLFSTRSKIDTAWQNWETKNINVENLKNTNVLLGLKNRAEEDLNPELSETSLFFRNELSEEGYRRLLEITSLDGLVEASQLSRMIGGVGNKIQAMLTKILLEEYGGGKLSKKHSSFFTSMLSEFGMSTKPEAYFEVVPWEVLANINHSFTVCEQKRNFLRYIGSLLYTEISVPSAFKNYKEAGERLGLSKKSIGYWDIHIKEDLRHGQWMLNEVAFPLIDLYQDSAWEILFGYDQQRFLSTRASQAIAESARQTNNA